MIKLFYTPLDYRCGTRLLFEEAMAYARPPDYSSILYLAPSQVKADEAQKLFHRFQGGSCYITPEIATIGGYCKKTYSTISPERVPRVVPGALIPLLIGTFGGGAGTGLSSVVADFIHHLKQSFPGQTADVLMREFAGILEALNIPGPVAANVMNALEAFRAYRAAADQYCFTDEDDIVNAFPLYAGSHACAGNVLVLDGFHAPTASEMNVMAALVRQAEHAFIGVPHDDSFNDLTKDYIGFLKERFHPEEIHVQGDVIDEARAGRRPLVYYSYPDSEEEAEGIARNIKLLYVSGKVKSLEEIVVAFPDLGGYAATVERVFSRYGIPYAFARGKRLGELRPLLDVLCLLSAVSEGYPRLKFAQFVSSKYFKKIPEHINMWMPSLSLRSGIVSGKSAWLDFMAEGSEALDIQMLPLRETIEKELRWLFRKLQPLEEMRKGAGYGRYAEALGKLLNDLEFRAAADEGVQKRITESFQGIFEQLSFLGELYPQEITLREFEDAFRRLLNAVYLEPGETGVRIMDFQQLQGLSPEYLFFGGLVDGVIPGRQQMDYVLPDSVKVRMGLLHLDKYIMIQKFIFGCAMKSAAHLQLSYPVMNGDTIFLPSSFLYSGEERAGGPPGRGGIFSKEEFLVRSGKRPLLDIIEEVRLAPPLAKLCSTLRVTDIDAYRACPRRFFIERILNLKPRGVKEYEIEAATLGTIIHRAMELLIREPFDDAGRLRQRAGEIIAGVTKDKKIDAYWKRIIGETFIELLPGIAEMEFSIRVEGYHSSEVEKNVSGEPVAGIKLKGKIDRIDLIGDKVQIIDYKTGAAGLNCAQALEGNENLQLFLYAAMLKNHGYRVSRVGIYSIKDMMIKWCPPQSRGRGKSEGGGRSCNGIDDYITASLRFLEGAVASLREGDFTARPLNDFQCWNCHEAAYCPYIQR